MKFELCGKHKAKLVKVDIQSAKRGQTDVVPAVALTLEVALPNSYLDMLDKGLLPFLYEKGASSVQQTLEGVAVVSDMPSLTRAASRLGTLSWDDEQSGSGLIIYQGVTGDGDIRLQDGLLTVKKIDAHEGGAWDATILYYTEDLDAETLGDLAVLKSHELDIEVTAPTVVAAQADLDDDDDHYDLDEDEESGNPFPLDADSSTAATSPFSETPSTASVTRRRSRLAQTPEQAFTDSVVGDTTH